MKIIYNKLIPFKNFIAINLFGTLFIREEYKHKINSDEVLKLFVLNHESIHTEQMKELGYIFFYIWYFIEWLIKIFQYKFNTTEAYRNVSFEREAYANEKDVFYNDKREHYSFLKYLKH